MRWRWVDREIDRLDPDVDWERMISLHVGHQVPVLGLAMMVYPGTMRMMQPAAGAETLAATGKLVRHPDRRFDDGNQYLTAWLVDGVSSAAGRRASERLNRVHHAADRATPHLPGNFDRLDDFVYPLVLLATSEDRLRTSLGLPPTGERMKIAWHRWAQTLFRHLERASGPLADEAFPEDWHAMTEFAMTFDARPYEPTPAGYRVAAAMSDHFAARWFPAPLRWFGRDLTRYLVGERVARLHRIGWPSPWRVRLVRLALRSAFRVQAVLPDYRTPLPVRIRRVRERQLSRRTR